MCIYNCGYGLIFVCYTYMQVFGNNQKQISSLLSYAEQAPTIHLLPFCLFWVIIFQLWYKVNVDMIDHRRSEIYGNRKPKYAGECWILTRFTRVLANVIRLYECNLIAFVLMWLPTLTVARVWKLSLDAPYKFLIKYRIQSIRHPELPYTQ